MNKLLALITLIMSIEIFFFVYLFFIFIPNVLFQKEEPSIIIIFLFMIMMFFLNLKFFKK